MTAEPPTSNSPAAPPPGPDGSPAERPLVVVAGPTGSGKSQLAVRLAERFDGEIVNCDSVQVYRHFNIGTAKVPAAERRGIPHHLLDIADPDETFTAGDFARVARAAIAGISERHRLPIVAGGTGFYLRALLDGLFEGPGRNEQVRRRLLHREALRPGSLHRILRRLDRGSAQRIHPHDTKKLTRALEVRLLTHRSLSASFARGRDALEGYRVLQLGLDPDRPLLYLRLDARTRRMFDEGLIDEVRHLVAMGYAQAAAGSAAPPEDHPPGQWDQTLHARAFESLGYAQALRFLKGELTLEQAIASAQMHTRRYAKRQWTWFRRDPAIVWLSGFGDDPEVERQASTRVAAFLAGFPAT